MVDGRSEVAALLYLADEAVYLLCKRPKVATDPVLPQGLRSGLDFL